MPSEIHNHKEIYWRNRLRNTYKCDFVGMEFPINFSFNEKSHNFRLDVYGKTRDGKEYLVEIGSIDINKLQILEQYAKQNPNITFIHDAYTESEMRILGYESQIFRKSLEPKKPKMMFNDTQFGIIAKQQPKILTESEIERVLKPYLHKCLKVESEGVTYYIPNCPKKLKDVWDNRSISEKWKNDKDWIEHGLKNLQNIEIKSPSL
jgi:hypothetical protein